MKPSQFSILQNYMRLFHPQGDCIGFHAADSQTEANMANLIWPQILIIASARENVRDAQGQCKNVARVLAVASQWGQATVKCERHDLAWDKCLCLSLSRMRGCFIINEAYRNSFNQSINRPGSLIFKFQRVVIYFHFRNNNNNNDILQKITQSIFHFARAYFVRDKKTQMQAREFFSTFFLFFTIKNNFLLIIIIINWSFIIMFFKIHWLVLFFLRPL